MDHKLITSIPLIERYSRHNEDEDWRFRNFLKHHLKLSNKELDAIVQEETDTVWSQIDCLSCGRCCRELEPGVDDEDIRRLAAMEKMSPGRFKRERTHLDDMGNRVLNGLPCVYLGSGNACAIYADRPKACRDYPYLRDSDFRSRSISMVSNVGFCPIVFNVWDALKAKLGRRPRERRKR
ncbi:MAG: YkgJ family cysteine cluster protein [Capsulimonadaceae bacterium]|nr:YkgJ family cysteine cluster protein [Capsulimonadaceae bacterium]